MITTSKYALAAQFSEKENRPVLKKLNFATMKLETIFLERPDNWEARRPIILEDFRNGDIAFGQGYHLFILNNETLEVKQTLTGKASPEELISDLKSFKDSKTNKLIYYVGKNQ